jgi:hypothetical protein
LLLQAFIAGKAASGLTMTAIRCISKAAFKGRGMGTLQLGVAVSLAAGAAVVAACLVIVGVVLPRLQANKKHARTTGELQQC